MKSILLIEDLTCNGGCSALISIPKIVELGYDLKFIPSVILSKHTANVSPIIDDYSEMMNKMVLELDYDYLFLGYLKSSCDLKYFYNIDKPIFLDPVMADNNKFYSGFNEEYIKKLMPIIKKSEVITPNYTEALFISGFDSNSNIEDVLNKLYSIGCKRAVITGVVENDLICVYGIDSYGIYKYSHEKIDGSFHGCGDAFKVYLFDYIIKNKSLVDAIKYASDMTLNIIKNYPNIIKH